MHVGVDGRFIYLFYINTGWWYTYPPEKYVRQLGWWHSQYMGKNHVPNQESTQGNQFETQQTQGNQFETQQKCPNKITQFCK